MVILWSCKGKSEKERKGETLHRAYAIFSSFFRIYEGEKSWAKEYLETKKDLHEITLQTIGNGPLVILNVFQYYANTCKGWRKQLTNGESVKFANQDRIIHPKR